jgi:transglutaminase-like putative cysteine protease
MKLLVHHRTEYVYQSPVSRNTNELRLQPMNTRWQSCESSYISVLPAVRMSSYEDLNLNRVHHFLVAEPHRRLIIESRSRVVTRQRVDPECLPYGLSFAGLGECKGFEECHPYLQSSHFVEVCPEAWRLGLDLKGEGDDVLATCIAMMQFIYTEFTYEQGTTDVSTHASEVLAIRKGVCQDFSHAMTAICRSLGIPARYVSGYFFDAHRDPVLRGLGASHAWVEVYLQGFGWFPLDPTNNKIVDETYIVLAVGRDYRDVAPVRGSYFGAGTIGLDVNVSVRKAD